MHGEVLALKLAAKAGINAANARVADSKGVPVAVAPLFGLGARAATGVLREVKATVKNWKDTARAIGMGAKECARFAPAFAHPEL